MAKTEKIKLLKSVAGIDYAYGKGEVVDAPAEIAKDLIRGKLAVKAKARATKQVATAVSREKAVPKVETMSSDEYAKKIKTRKSKK